MKHVMILVIGLMAITEAKALDFDASLQLQVNEGSFTCWNKGITLHGGNLTGVPKRLRPLMLHTEIQYASDPACYRAAIALTDRLQGQNVQLRFTVPVHLEHYEVDPPSGTHPINMTEGIANYRFSLEGVEFTGHGRCNSRNYQFESVCLKQ